MQLWLPHGLQAGKNASMLQRAITVCQVSTVKADCSQVRAACWAIGCACVCECACVTLCVCVVYASVTVLV